MVSPGGVEEEREAVEAVIPSLRPTCEASGIVCALLRWEDTGPCFDVRRRWLPSPWGSSTAKQ